MDNKEINDKIEKAVNILKNKIVEGFRLEENKRGKKRFFLSDSHFEDERLNLYGRDILFKNAKEVDEYIVKICNEVLPEDAELYHLGDVSMTLEGLENMNKIKCKKKILIKGNYDISVENGGTAKYEISDKVLLKYFDEVYDELEIEIDGEIVYLNHFPTNSKEQYMNIMGHIHAIFKVSRNIINVGLDAWHFTPVSEEMVKFQMNGIRNHYDQNCFPNELISSVKNRVGKVIVLRAVEEYKVATFDECKDIFLFLAGPIDGTNSVDMWQEKFIRNIQEKLKNIKTNKNIVLCSPRRLEKPKDFVYEEQVDWEGKYLQKAANQGIIVFWLAKQTEKFDGKSFARTTRIEFGEWFAKGQQIKDFKMVVGYEKGFDGFEYIENRLKSTYPDSKLENSVDDMVEEIVKIIKQKI